MTADNRTAVTAPTRDPIDRTAWIGLTIVSLALYMSVVDASAVNVAFPSVLDDLETSRATLSWMISAYTITTASLLLMAGHLADAVGRKRVFMASLSVFVIGSVIAGVADTFSVLIIGRIVQGIGSAGVLPSSLALILPLFPASRRSTAIGIWGSMASAGAATGPTVGALLIDAASWRAIFWINVPIGLLAVALTALKVPESRSDSPVAAAGRLDPLGVPIATIGVAMLMLAMVQSEDWGVFDARTLGLVALGGVMLPLSIQRSRTHPRPAIDLSLFRVPSFWPAVIVVALFGNAFLGGFLSTTLYLQNLWGYSVLTTGLALSPGPVLATIVSMYSGRLAERVGHRMLVSAGTLAMGSSYLYLAVAGSDEPAYVTRFLPASLLLGLGLGLSLANITGFALSQIPPQKYAIANATSRTLQQMAYAFGIAVMVTLLGSGVIGLGDFRRGWYFVFAMYLASALAALTLFSSREPDDRTS